MSYKDSSTVSLIKPATFPLLGLGTPPQKLISGSTVRLGPFEVERTTRERALALLLFLLATASASVGVVLAHLNDTPVQDNHNVTSAG